MGRDASLQLRCRCTQLLSPAQPRRRCSLRPWHTSNSALPLRHTTTSCSFMRRLTSIGCCETTRRRQFHGLMSPVLSYKCIAPWRARVWIATETRCCESNRWLTCATSTRFAAKACDLSAGTDLLAKAGMSSVYTGFFSLATRFLVQT